MSDSRAALRYAKAVLNFAVEKKAANAVEDDMRSIVATISESKELRNMLQSPVIKEETKKESLAAIFAGSNEITLGLLGTLAGNKRVSLLNEVALKYIILNEDLKGEGVAYVTTAVPLTPELEKKVLKQVAQLTGNEVSIQNKIDESIIGGFILRVGDLQYDASIANKLNNLKREFTNSL
ncbi:ATP synthase F1 subunit delta [Euzebyella marina]|uniref:ATP synthase subunit delta n=1 Tax=Euzebyella marina TaxID=1761453 RepID=A0A3G2L1I4_9FLAO|nr:ATP synthase F1 subunit delta [Euzebyella marina]AYN66118.1 ATP synthase F1 subunit delta [Euzebyella marina]MAU71087.1 ATP synthase F1 subunit delta [Pseudozobellia sp.]MBF01139.1 ATP synthase F1 subunit delta [Flavobacterium sp.]MBG49158.1 ATP synthase F1 subunit delta [Pseudozobellia sp.]|tara:strand:- start:228 stop:767 length:540 start_codon:yes stop_codon:yes gene_type:complete